MDWSPVAEPGCVGGEIGMSSEPSTKKMEPVVRSAVFGQSIGMEQNACAGSSIGITVLTLPADLIIALIAPPAPCENRMLEPAHPQASGVVKIKLVAGGVAALRANRHRDGPRTCAVIFQLDGFRRIIRRFAGYHHHARKENHRT